MKQETKNKLELGVGFGIHVCLLGASAWWLLFFVPTPMRLYTEVQADLPCATQMVFRLSQCAQQYVLPFAVIPILIVVMDILVYRMLAKNVSRRAGEVWLAVVIALLAAGFSVMLIATFLPDPPRLVPIETRTGR